MNEEFETIGLGKARMQLTELAKIGGRHDNAPKVKIIEELYVEIRAARSTECSWIRIRKALVQNIKDLKISAPKLCEMFHKIDVKYEKETGEPALPVVTKHWKKRRADQQ